MHASGSRYRIGVQSDPMDFLAWLLNALHTALGGTKAAGSSIIHTTFQGTVEVTTRSAAAATIVGDTASKAAKTVGAWWKEELCARGAGQGCQKVAAE